MRKVIASGLWWVVVLLKPIHLGLSLRMRKWVNNLIWLHQNANDSRPVVFVQVAAYNAEDTIGETLESLLDQTYLHWVAVIVNDGSADHTSDLCKEYCLRDSRFVLLEHEKNEGLNQSRNSAILYARQCLKWSVMAVLDSDDVANPEWLEVGVEGINKGALGVRCLNGRYNWDLTEHKFNYMACAQTFFSRDALDALGGYRLAPYISDHDMMERLEKLAVIKKGFVLTTLIQVQRMRFSENNMSVHEAELPGRQRAKYESEHLARAARKSSDISVEPYPCAFERILV